jgi:hypothetical protein
MKKTRFPRQSGGKDLELPDALSGRGKYYEYTRVCPESSESLELVRTVAVGIYTLVPSVPTGGKGLGTPDVRTDFKNVANEALLHAELWQMTHF